MRFLCVFLLNLLTGAVGLPLPGVEVQIVMSNTTNTTIVEGNHRETQVINEWTSYEADLSTYLQKKKSMS